MSAAACRIRVPASTSNLGAGFDCVGLALDRYLEVDFTPGDSPLEVERHRELSGIRDDDDLLLKALDAGQGPGAGACVRGSLSITSDIPIGRGLGSSAAAVVAGLLLARHLAGADTAGEAVLPSALAFEGHPDNVAPALLGGLVAIATDASGAARPIPHPISPDLAFAFAAPGVQLATARARAALPADVPHTVARRALARLPALLRGLATADPALLRMGFEDDLHVPYRLPLIPGGAQAIAAGLAAGAWAVTISGAGSGLIAACPPDAADSVADAMRAAFEGMAGAEGGIGFVARVDGAGAAVRV